MKHLLYGILTLLFISILPTKDISAQTATIDDVFSIRLRTSGIIKDNNGIKGYYFFYKKEKVDRKTNTYLLKILDENLNVVANKEITDTKQLMLQSGTFNGDVIMLKFYDYKKKELSYRSFTKDGELLKTDAEIINNKYLAATFKVSDDDVTRPVSMFSVGKKGFVDYSMIKTKRYGYQMKFISTDGKSKNWNFISNENVKTTLTGNFLYGDDDLILSAVLDRPKLLSNKGMKYFIAANDVNTGKQQWSTQLVDSKYELSLINTFPEKEKGQIVLFGAYFKKGADIAKAKSIGLFSFIMDIKTGEITNRNFISWVKDAGKFLPIKDNGKIESVGYVFFHQFVRTADGRIFGVGEQYRKAVSGGAVALNVLAAASGGNSDVSNIKMVIEDFYIFEFNQDFSLKDIKVFEKGKSNIPLAQGMGLVSAATLAQVLKYEGAFDFYFVQTEDDNEVMHIGYLDYDRLEKGSSKESYFGAITYTEGEFSQDRVMLERKWRTDLVVLPAKAGHILIMEYNRKAKELVMRLEAINF